MTDTGSIQGRIDGALLRPGDAGHDRARQVWNGAAGTACSDSRCPTTA